MTKLDPKEEGLPSRRVPYSAIVDRPRLQLPDDGRMLVWVIVNVEHWSMERPMPRTVLSPPMGQPLQPDLPNWAWHEYGMRVGFWRLYDALTKQGIVPTLALNGVVCRSYPRVAQAALESGWEFMGHGYVQGPMHALPDQRAAIAETVRAIQDFTGKPPVGWESPGLTETSETLDHLAEAGIEYVADWVMDDQPVWIPAKPRPVLSVPYSVEINDIPMMLLQSHDGEELYRRGVAQLDRLWQESATIPRVMAISVHPYITGVPHRIAVFERLLAYAKSKPGVLIRTGAQINDWYRTQVPAPS
ncbi:MAG: polysaccharide deacetylase family protein [Hylemonella sp.]|jgi:peptidoglycan/xylan/chitin deacetylase (PgdA/CDA1 family)